MPSQSRESEPLDIKREDLCPSFLGPESKILSGSLPLPPRRPRGGIYILETGSHFLSLRFTDLMA